MISRKKAIPRNLQIKAASQPMISSPAPRLYTTTTTIPGQTTGYDVFILVDFSGSMNESDCLYISKFQYAMQVMMIVSESLQHLPGINLEVLAFTADRYFNDLLCNNFDLAGVKVASRRARTILLPSFFGPPFLKCVNGTRFSASESNIIKLECLFNCRFRTDQWICYTFQYLNFRILKP